MYIRAYSCAMAKKERFNFEVTPEEKQSRLSYHVRMGEVAAEKRSGSVGIKSFEAWSAMFPEFGINGKLNSNISVTAAQKLSIVFTCLNVLGETLGSLPYEVKRKTKDGRVSDTQHEVYRLIHDRPNPFCTAFTFWSTVQKLKKAWGNAYVKIQRDRNARPVALWIMLSWEVTPTMMPGMNLVYLWRGETLDHTDVLHFKNYSMDGFMGISTIKQNAITIDQGLKLKEYNSNIISTRPTGFLTSETRPKDSNVKANMKKSFNSQKEEAAPDNSTPYGQASMIQPEAIMGGALGGIPLLYGGMKFQAMSLPADDVAYIQSTELTNKDIYGIFRVPPIFGQDYANAPYNSSEQQDIIFGKYGLADIKDFEQECTEKLFPESNKTEEFSYYVKFNLKALLAGDTTTRQAFYNAMFQIGVLSANDIRELEDLPHYEGGDGYFIQGALVPIEKMGEYIDAKISKLLEGPSKPAGAGAEPDADEAAAATRALVRSEIMNELRGQMKSKLNGHYKDVEALLQ